MRSRFPVFQEQMTMPSLQEILSDLNVTIADSETFLAELPIRHNELVRAIGQLKAARASIVRAKQDKDLIHCITSQGAKQ